MQQPELLEVPEWAIRVFENLTGLQVAVHDLDSKLGAFLQPERFKHHAPCCVAVKALHDWACVDFEVTRLRAEILRQPEGRCHRCHAGFVEWVMPAFVEGRLAWILFAGQRAAAGEHPHLIHDIRATKNLPAPRPPLAKVDASESEAILEALRQLRSRLLEWQAQAAAKLAALPAPGGARRLESLADRRLLIQGFLHRSHTGPAPLRELARALHLGESRAAHLVKELFGRSYVKLLNELRLRTAASLLRESRLSVLEVALGSGFRDIAHFHRCFRRRFACTPRHYRRSSPA